MKENVFLSVKEQIELLKKRGMIVDDLNILETNNYSHLIHRYGVFYLKSNQTSQDHIFRDGTKLSNVFNLYKLNNEVSLFILKYIIKFEHLLKTFVAKKLVKSIPYDTTMRKILKFLKKNIEKNLSKEFIKQYLEFAKKTIDKNIAWKKRFLFGN